MLEPCLVCGDLFDMPWRAWYHDHVPKVTGVDCAVAYFGTDRHTRPEHDGSFSADGRFEPFMLQDHGFRSALEERFARWCATHEILFRYEPYKVALSDGDAYVPDFYLPASDIFVEVKGLWEPRGKRKFRQLLIDIPTLNLVVVDEIFMRQTSGRWRERERSSRG